jgi:tetratricopeptide (TPR) repeat protein/DNA-binding NarL/FixJ family response regulator
LRTVLIAEQHLPTSEHLRGELTQAGYVVRCASEPGRAMELFLSDPSDLVVIAVDFPRLDGSHVGQLIRSSAQGNLVPMIAIDKGHLGKAKGIGAVLDLRANAYVADVLKGNELLEKVASLRVIAERAKEAVTSGLQSVLGRSPVAAGELKGFPLPALLHSFYRLRREGVLVVAFRDLTRRVFYVGGAPVSYDSTARQDGLPVFLHERGELTDAQVELVQQALSSGSRLSMALADAGVSLAGEELLQRLRDFTREKVAQVVGMREGRYAFFAGNEFAEEISVVDVPALAPILDGARRAFPVKVFAQALKPHLPEFPSRSSDFGPDLTALGLNNQDLKVAMQANGRISLSDLIAHGRGEVREAYGLSWFLSLTGDLSFSKTPVSSVGANAAYAAPDVIAPRKRKPLPAETVAELRDAAVKIITSSYFRVLGLDIAADTEAVERAYHEVATRFHPDSYPEYDSSEIKDLLDSVQEKLSASYRVLSIEDKRRAYLQYLFSRLDVSRSTGVNIDAEIALKHGNAALKRGDPRTAMSAFEQAVSLNPREPEYYCYLAWATYLAGSGEPKERAKAAQKLLRKALGLNPYLERATVISAIIDGETGDTTGARKRLVKVLEMNPSSQLAKAALLKVGR